MQHKNTIPDGPYQPQQSEGEISEYWNKHELFKAPDKPSKKTFSMVMPPPNITSSLHLGHALDLTLPDIIARYKRLQGYAVCWFPGTDQAGLATNTVVERALEKEGINKEELGREAFIEKVWEWKETCGNRIIEQIHLLGASADWSKLRFTKDPAYEKAIRHAFVAYYRDGLIYRGHRIVQYCPRCRTALSDIEVDFIEENNFLYYIRYPVENSDDYITVATTRPETMLGDTAVAVNPEDPRYQKFHGKNLLLPLIKRNIPIIVDDHVEKDFGTGALKITPAHDPADFVIGRRHALEEISVIDHGRTMNANAGPYKGLSVSKAREAILADLETEGYLIRKEPYTHSVGHCSRCNKTVEPLISDQWYLKTSELSQRAMQEVEKGETRFIPDRWLKVYRDWMENIQDWCISRQIWWGIQIPVWYCECGEIFVGESDPDIRCKTCGKTQWKQDEDVLDTWFGSALWPFAVMGWPENTKELDQYYPSDLLVTGFDIIFFWVARMLFSGLHFTNKVPFREVYFHGLIRDKQGRKMSKSLNNGIDPAELIQTYGADALRFTLASLSTIHGQDICVDPVKIASSRNFVNKLWNAFRFSLEKIANSEESKSSSQENLWNIWIQLRWNATRDEVCANLENFKFNEACNVLYAFFWDDFCDWYIEVSKYSLHTEVLHRIMRNTLILMHPILPFITEKLWSYLPETSTSIMLASIPEKTTFSDEISSESIENIAFVQTVIKSIRHLKSEFNLSSPEGIIVHIHTLDHKKTNLVHFLADDIQKLSKVEQILINREIQGNAVTSVVFSDLEIALPLNGLIDIEKDILSKKNKFDKLEKELEKLENKLQNQNFMQHAPEHIVQEIQLNCTELKGQLDHLEKRIQYLQKMDK
jgi:valyl-tRNA synthetase